MKYAVMSKGGELKGTNYAISDQFPAEIMRRRRLLYPIMAEARQRNKRARLFADKLYIDGKLYRNYRITYWLDSHSPGSKTENTGMLPKLLRTLTRADDVIVSSVNHLPSMYSSVSPLSQTILMNMTQSLSLSLPLSLYFYIFIYFWLGKLG